MLPSRKAWFASELYIQSPSSLPNGSPAQRWTTPLCKRGDWKFPVRALHHADRAAWEDDSSSVKRLTETNHFRGLGSACPMPTQRGSLVNIAITPYRWPYAS